MPNIHNEVLIGASAEKVYEAITEQRGLAAWWTPGARTTTELGSIARFAFGDGYFKEMMITAMEHLAHVVWVCVAGADEWIGTVISFELKTGSPAELPTVRPEVRDQAQQLDREEATLVILKHEHWREHTPVFAECSYTWSQFLRSLKLFCETGEGRPWPHQHRH